jgi:hypothetical protein
MATLKDARDFIRNATSGELDTIVEMLKSRRNELNLDALHEFKVGDKVQFDSGRRGMVYGTIVERKGAKFVVKPSSGFQNWRVAPALLRPYAG